MDIQNKIPANKFYSPKIDASACLFRKRLVIDTLANRGTGRIIIINAQAGQGKTTLALQFLEYSKVRYAWYQIGLEDRDPVLMFAALLECLMKSVPRFRPLSLLNMVNEGDLNVHNLPHAVSRLSTELASVLEEELYLVFDDLHLLADSPAVTLLESLLAASFTRLNFLFLGRQPLQLNITSVSPAAGILELGKEDMALSIIETMELFNQVLGLNLSWKKASEVHTLTEGWIMGQIMIASALHDDEVNIDDIYGLAARSGLNSYLKNEVFAHLPQEMAVNMVKLALLDEIEIPLAIALTGDADICGNLKGIAQCNYFLRALNSEMKVFRLHHLCRDFLREKAADFLGAAELAAALKLAAEYYLAKDLLETALSYYSRAGAWQYLENVLESRGMGLVAMNRGVTLLSLLASVPLAERRHMAWLNVLAGIVSIQIAPANCQPLLEQALLQFKGDGSQRGELLATSQLICLHWVSTGAFEEGMKLLPRAEELYVELADSLPVYDRILVCSNISCGFSVFKSEIDKARYYSSEAMGLAVRHGMKNFIATILFTQGYSSYFCDQFVLTCQDIEKAQGLLVDHHVGLFNRISLMSLQVDVLGMCGELDNYRHQEGLLIELLGQELIEQTTLWAFLPIWRTAIAIARGRFQEALDEIMGGHGSGMSSMNPHLRSLLLQWQALALSLLGRNVEALSAAEESLALRRATGGPFFVAYNSLIIGAAFLHMGDLERAAKHLNLVLDIGGRLGHSYFIAAACLQLAYIRSRAGAVDDYDALRRALSILKDKKRTYCWGLTPAMIEELIGQAVKSDIEVEWARRIAAESLNCAVMDSGELVPLLEIKILGGFSISIGGRTVCRTENLPPAQRQLMAAIIAEPDQKISQEKVQLLFWPESTPARARSKLDVLMLRLRKSLGAMIKPLEMKNYLSLRKGIICLERCRIDAVDFVSKARAGLRYAQRRESWQAGNNFYPAMKLWQGCFASDIFSEDQVQEYCYELRLLLVKSSMKWGDILTEMGRMAEAVEVLERAFVYEPLNEQLVKMLYGLHMTANNAPQAQQVVERYKNILRMDDYEAAEISEMLREVVMA